MLLSKNLNSKETACKCGCGFGDTFGLIDPQLVIGFQVLRDTLGTPLHINSGARCFKHNNKIGGSQNSQHLIGKALDVRSDIYTPSEIAAFASQIPIFYNGGIGTYKTFVHLDTGNKRRWKG